MIKITFDTNIFPDDEIMNSCIAKGIDVAVITVTERELEGTNLEKYLKNITIINEVAIFDESRWGKAVWGSEETKKVMDDILSIISNKSFPTDRSSLSQGQLRQLRDAMILEAHIRNHRDILVTNDERAFIRNNKRNDIEEKYQTKIMTLLEFSEHLHNSK
jgi:predicted nucleic acid-binding protein